MPLYNFTMGTNLVQLLQNVNALAHEQIGIMLYIVFAFVFFVSLKTFETMRAILATSFIMSILSVLMFLLQIIPDALMYASWFVFAIVLLAMYFKPEYA